MLTGPAPRLNEPLPSSTPSPPESSLTSNSSSPLPVTWWHPQPGLTWQWHIINTDVDTSIEADVYDIDLYVAQSIIDELHAKNRRVIGYISVGSWENWRPDQDMFPPEVLGSDYEGWTGERWLDIRQIDKFAPIMRARLDLCKAKGFDAVEPDNMEIHSNGSGFPITFDDQLRYAVWLANEAHQRGLAIGMKNAVDQVKELVTHFDFAITEDYFHYRAHEKMLPFIEAGKPVFAAEYTDMDVDFDAACKWGKAHGVSFILKQRLLDAWVKACP